VRPEHANLALGTRGWGGRSRGEEELVSPGPLFVSHRLVSEDLVEQFLEPVALQPLVANWMFQLTCKDLGNQRADRRSPAPVRFGANRAGKVPREHEG
jgi:hypothetical protein